MTSSRFQIINIPLFKIFAYLDDGLVRTKTEGLAAPLLDRLAGGLTGIFDGQQAVKVEGDTLFFSTWMPPVPDIAFERLVKNQMKNMIAEGLWKLGIPVPTNPDQVTISITEECPNRCIHCALPDTRNRTILPLQTVKNIIDQAVDMGVTQLIFDGGEPMMYEGLVELVAHVPRGAISTVFTSGSGLTREKAHHLAKAGLFAVNVSFDSPHGPEHDRIRGRADVFQEAVAAIKHSLAAGLLVDIYVVAAPHNINDLDEFYELAVDLGVHELSFYEIVPTGRWLDHEKEILLPNQRQILDEFIARKSGGPVRLFSIPHVMDVTGCFAGRRWLHVTPAGDVLPCACIPISYGNINQRSLKDIWRTIQRTGIYRAPSCLMRDSDFRARYIEINTQ